MSIPADAHGHAHGKTALGALEWLAIVAAGVILAFLIYDYVTPHHVTPVAEVAHAAPAHGAEHATEAAEPEGPPAGYEIPPIWACIPFAAILLAIAVLPLIPATAHWWESNKNRLVVSLSLAAVTLLYYAFVHPMTFNHVTHQTYTGMKSVVHVLQHAVLIEYIPFIVLLFSLYVISGGISLRGDLAAHPVTNAAFLGVGGLLASFIGTTGASMLLIRPLLQTNKERKHVVHTVIFFIFIVSNCGGLLLPIGDPPLFLGYLKGVPFLWTLHLFVEWAVVVGGLLIIYYIWDTVAYRKEAKKDITLDETQREKLKLRGGINFVWLIGIVLCVGMIDPSKPLPLLGFKPFPFMRELVMLGLVFLSQRSTSKEIYRLNQFNYHAILEVAALFIGIFICMQVPIEILHEKGRQLGLSEPWHFFWATGGLSAFLDNAPTYVVFFETAKTLPVVGHALDLSHGAGLSTISVELLTAVSVGAVFMGALTYIGNGPNFMVKSIAEQSGVKMPSFFGYMAYSFGILIPFFIAITLIFIV
ncbi:MAG TPA: sodium:proton antiporter [Phycisphaerae bacterium]|nr:sodium:proton antiporter [Phycisphaerales bacterium]HRX86259.1 sodium:proton antiporter [Phycisphaerae bacterium]